MKIWILIVRLWVVVLIEIETELCSGINLTKVEGEKYKSYKNNAEATSLKSNVLKRVKLEVLKTSHVPEV